MGIDDKKIKEMLISGGYVTGENVKKAEKFAKDNNTLVTEYLFLEGLITKDILGQALAEYFKVPRLQVRIIKGFTSRNKIVEVI